MALTNKQLEEIIRDLHPQQYSDNAIAVWVKQNNPCGTQPSRVKRLREGLGLPAQPRSQRTRDSAAKSHGCLVDSQIVEAIKLLHPRGYPDAEIARVLAAKHNCRVNRHRVGRLRAKLKLSSNQYSDRHRAKVAAITKNKLAAAGLSSLAELRVQKFNIWKRKKGYPTELTVRAVQAAELIRVHEMLTRVQLCELMGIDSTNRLAPTSNRRGGTVLAELLNAGYIGVLKKVVGNGRTKTDLYYWIPRNDRQTKESTEPQ